MNNFGGNIATLQRVYTPNSGVGQVYAPAVPVNTMAGNFRDIKIPGVELSYDKDWTKLHKVLWKDGSPVVTEESRILAYEIYMAALSTQLKAAGHVVMDTYSEMVPVSKAPNTLVDLPLPASGSSPLASPSSPPKEVEREKVYFDFDVTMDQIIEHFSKIEAKTISSVAILSLPMYKKERNKYHKEMHRMKAKVDVVSGIHQCRSCRSYKTKTIILQMRSGDEGDTHKTTCQNCGTSWSEH